MSYHTQVHNKMQMSLNKHPFIIVLLVYEPNLMIFDE